MHRLRRESRQAKSDVLRAAGKWNRVEDPFAAVRDDGLPGRHIQFAEFMLHSQRAPQDYGVLVKFRSLARFLPAFRTAHVSNAAVRSRRVDTAHVFFNDLRLISSGFAP